MNIVFLKDNLIRFWNNAHDKKLSFPRSIFQEALLFIRFGCSPDDYFRYEFYKKTNFERDKFITYRRSQSIIHRYNDAQYTHIFSDKAEFNKRFDEYLGRDWIDMRSCSEEEFHDFVKHHNSVLVKPFGGGQGKGIFKLTYDQLNEFDFGSHRDYIAEEILQQHVKMQTLNQTSVNTVRVLTFKGEIIACALRIGGDDSIVDNLHSNGVCAHLDPDKGIIDALCIDNHLNKYLLHPKTKAILPGFQVPNWDIVKRTVIQAAKEVPQVQYIGWDVAILQDGVAIIEGNHDPGHDVVQMIAQTGLYDRIREMI